MSLIPKAPGADSSGVSDNRAPGAQQSRMGDEEFNRTFQLHTPDPIGAAPSKITLLLAEARRARESEAAALDALELLHPNNSASRYEDLAEAFTRKTGLTPPGHDRPAAMGGQDIDDGQLHRTWRLFVNEWHERFFDDLLKKAGRR